MRLAGMTNQSELAALVGISPQNIQYLVTKGKGSTHNSKIAAILSVDSEWLAYGIGEPRRQLIKESTAPYNSAVVPSDELQRTGAVPLLSYISAGKWRESPSSFAKSDAELWLPCPIAHGERSFALRVDGYSMTSPFANEKSFPHGSYVYFDPDLAVKNGSFVAAYLPRKEAITFKQFVEDAGRKFLHPLNPSYDDIPIAPEDMIEIWGVLIGSFTPA